MKGKNSVRRKLIAYLYKVANGYAPKDETYGLCTNVQIEVGIAAYEMLRSALLELYGDRSYPLGEKEYKTFGNKYVGERGDDRRALAGFVAAYLESEIEPEWVEA